MGSGLGLTLGTAVKAKSISIVFAVVLTPLLFTGCSQYPWPSLSRLRWFQDLTLLNPLTYMSEGVRASLVPQVPHMRPWIAGIMLIVATILLIFSGVRGFLRRAID
jgi:ABC-2 type transport system permease protein